MEIVTQTTVAFVVHFTLTSLAAFITSEAVGVVFVKIFNEVFKRAFLSALVLFK